MKLLLDRQRAKLLANARANFDGDKDFAPVVKLFTPDAGMTWLLSELDEDGIAFGLCDLGLGFAELGSVSLAEIEELRGQLGLPVERDRYFKAKGTLGKYADAARKAGGRIVEQI